MATDELGRVVKYHEEDGKAFVSYQSDIEALLKANAEQRASRSVFDKKGDMHHIMRIDMVTLQSVCTKYGLDFFNSDDAKVILKILKGPEYAAFRTYPGKI